MGFDINIVALLVFHLYLMCQIVHDQVSDLDILSLHQGSKTLDRSISKLLVLNSVLFNRGISDALVRSMVNGGDPLSDSPGLAEEIATW